MLPLGVIVNITGAQSIAIVQLCNERNRQVWENVNIDKQPRGHLQLGANGNDANADRQTEKRGGAVDTWIRLTERGRINT